MTVRAKRFAVSFLEFSFHMSKAWLISVTVFFLFVTFSLSASDATGVAYFYTNSVLFASAELSSGSGQTSDTDSMTSSLFRTATSTECPANSEIAEVIVVNAAMSVGEIAATQAYLKAKWGTP